MKKTLKNFSLFVLCLFFISIIGCSEPNKEPTVVYVPQDNGGNNGGTQTPKTGTLVIQNRILQSNYDRLEYQIYGPNDYSNLYTGWNTISYAVDKTHSSLPVGGYKIYYCYVNASDYYLISQGYNSRYITITGGQTITEKFN